MIGAMAKTEKARMALYITADLMGEDIRTHCIYLKLNDDGSVTVAHNRLGITVTIA